MHELLVDVTEVVLDRLRAEEHRGCGLPRSPPRRQQQRDLLKHHFEQNFHVRHRIDRYGAGRRLDFDASPPDAIAQEIAREIGREVDYRPVARDGGARAAKLIGELL